MRKTRELLRLALGQKLSRRRVAGSLAISPATVADCLGRAKVAGIAWPLDPAMDDATLEARLYPPPRPSSMSRPLPDFAYIHKELRRKGVTLMLLWQEYRSGNPDGLQYSQFCASYRRFRGQVDFVMRQTYRAGEMLFADFSGDGIPIADPHTGEVKEAPLFLATLGASDFTYAEVTEDEGLASWIQAHIDTYEFFDGVPEITVPDNTKDAVTRPCFYDPDINRTYLEMARHYGTAIIPARVKKPRDKAKVESAVLIAQRWILAALRNHTFFSIEQARRAVAEKLVEFNDRPLQKLGVSRRDLFEQLDRPALKPLPGKRYEYADWLRPKVNVDYHVECFKHYYSVPFSLIGKYVDARVTATTVEIIFNGQRVASHARSAARGRFSTQTDHMPPQHRQYSEWTPERIVEWAGKTGPSTAKLAEAIMASRDHPVQGMRACMGIIRLGRVFGKERLEAASAKALDLRAYSYRTVETILKNGMDRNTAKSPKRTEPVTHENVRGPEPYN